MFEEPSPEIRDVARAIEAGNAVDWESAESSAPDETSRTILRELKIIAAIAALHRNLTDQPGQEEPASPETAHGLGSWGPLRLLQKVGEGSFGEVYRAWDPRLDREVALKLIRREEPGGRGVASTVIEEGRLLARVRHVNVVTVHGADRIDDRVGLWMEFIDGSTLEQVLRDRGPFSAQEAALVGLDLCRALSAVHAAGLVHRDVKAQNVMREAGGRLVLMDFGTGSEHDSEPRGGDLSGTPLYIAPEIFAGNAATVRSDIYSLGVLLFHLVTAGFPVTGRTVRDVREQHARGERRLLRDLRPDLPERFIQVVERALSSSPNLRFESAGAMEVAIASTLAREEPSTRSQPTDAPVARPRGRRLLLAAVGATATLAGLIAFNAWGMRDRLVNRSAQPDLHTQLAMARDGTAVDVRRLGFPGRYSWAGQPSADGRLFSFSDADGDLAVADLTTRTARKLTNKGVGSKEQAYARMPISGDARWIAYTWNTLDGASELRIIRMDGEEPRVLVRRPDIDVPFPYEWSADNTHLLAVLRLKDGTNSIALVRVADGSVREVKNLGPGYPPSASLSPDGRFVVYDSPQRKDGYERDLHIIEVDSGRQWPLVEHGANDVYPLWTPDGSAVVFASDRAVGTSIFRQPVAQGRPRGEPELVQRNLGRIVPFAITRTGELFYHAQLGMVDVYTADVDFPSNRVGQPKSISSGVLGSNISSEWSPDGRSLAFVTTHGLMYADRFSRTLSIRDRATSSLRELRPALAFFIDPRWSPDGREILVRGYNLEAQAGAFVVDVDTSRVRPVFLVPSENQAGLFGAQQWTADGDVLYDHEPRGIVRRDLVSGGETILASYATLGVKRMNGPTSFQFSPDRKMLGFSGRFSDGENLITTVKVKPLNGEPVEVVRTTTPGAVRFEGWTPDSREVLFVRAPGNSDQPATLWRVPAAGGEPRSMGLSLPSLRSLHVHPDGRQLTFTAGLPYWEIWVMENVLQR